MCFWLVGIFLPLASLAVNFMPSTFDSKSPWQKLERKVRWFYSFHPNFLIPIPLSSFNIFLFPLKLTKSLFFHFLNFRSSFVDENNRARHNNNNLWIIPTSVPGLHTDIGFQSYLKYQIVLSTVTEMKFILHNNIIYWCIIMKM